MASDMTEPPPIENPDAEIHGIRPRIGVIGVGGAGGNAVNNMIRSGLAGVEFIAANTDAQALSESLAERKLQLGATITQGLGAGAGVEIGRAAAEETLGKIRDWVSGFNMLFIAAGLGGGTGTGAAPIIAEAARQQGVLTVGIVTLPFNFEGTQRMRAALQGFEELERQVDSLIVIPNQNLFRLADAKTTFTDAFTMADDVLHHAVRGITDLVVLPGLINLDFADVEAVVKISGRAMMGSSQAEGEGRAVKAAEAAISNPLLDISSVKGAQGVLINITGGADMTLFEVDQAATRVRAEVDPDSVTIFGSAYSPDMDGKIRVSVVATGLRGEKSTPEPEPEPDLVPEPEPEPVEDVEPIAEQVSLSEDAVFAAAEDRDEGLPEVTFEHSSGLTGPTFDEDLVPEPAMDFEQHPPLPSAFTDNRDADTFDPFLAGTQSVSGGRDAAQAKKPGGAFAWLTGRGRKPSED